MKMEFSTNLDAYLLLVAFILGAASAYFYIQSSPVNRGRRTKNESDNKNNVEKTSEINNKNNSGNENNNNNEKHSNNNNNNKNNESCKKEEKIVKGKDKNVRIYVDGCWDLCHSGHYNAIRQAKSLGDHLVVGVHSCEEIARNKRWPIMNDKERMACVEACKWVDQVVFDVPYSPSIELLDRGDVSCDYVAHGDDIAIAANGQSAYAAVESRLKIFKRTPGVSTTNLIDRIISALNYQESMKAKISNNESVSASASASASGSEMIGKEKESDCEAKNKIGSWSQFLSSSHRIAAFSNGCTPKQGEKVVYIDGIFDLFHAGHIAAIKEAKKEGAFLYVGLFDDTIVRKQKGPYFPLMNIQERTLNVLSCKFVDEVIIGCPWIISEDMIKVLNIDTVVTTHITNELSDENDERFKYVREKGMLKQVMPKDSQLTTDKLMKRIAKDQARMEKENENRVKKEMQYMQTRQYVEEA